MSGKGDLYIQASADGTKFDEPKPVVTTALPRQVQIALAEFKTQLYVAWCDGDTIRIWSSLDGTNFQRRSEVKAPSAVASSLTTFGDRLYLVAKSDNGAVKAWSSPDGVHFYPLDVGAEVSVAAPALSFM